MKQFEENKRFSFKGEYYNLCEYELNSTMVMDDEIDPDLTKIDFELRVLLAERSRQLGMLLSCIRASERGEDADTWEKQYFFYREQVKNFEEKLNERISELEQYDIYHPIVPANEEMTVESVKKESILSSIRSKLFGL
jgi:hypothetical protein